MLEMNVQELDAIREECRQLVKKKARQSATVAVLPVPILDLAADARLFSRLLPQITRRFGLTPEQIEQMPSAQREKVHWHLQQHQPGFFGQAATSVLVRKNLLAQAGRLAIRQVAKFVPVTGSLVAGTLGYLVLKKMANQYIEDCYEVARAIWSQPHPPVPQGA